MKLNSVVLLGVLSFPSVLFAQVEQVYVQTARGSFNHQAVAGLYESEKKKEVDFLFSGTPESTFQEAAAAGKPAFVALRNDLVPGYLVGQTIEAMTNYRVVSVSGAAVLPIEMCLLRSKNAVNQGVPLTSVASHPAALKQINRWKQGRGLKELEDANGTSAAAEKVATGQLSSGTGAIASCWLAELYPQLTVVEKAIQDTADNKTLFGRLIVERRSQSVDEGVARLELQQVVDQAQKIAVKVVSQ